MEVDVVIIGAGPGGGMAACRLARSGLRVAVMDRARLPRAKPCGGAMPARVRRLVDWEFSPFVEAEVLDRRHRLRSARAVTVRRGSPMLLVDRSRFDLHLVERALREGRGDVVLREGFEARAVEEDERGVTVRDRGGEGVRARWLIAADGPSSPSARALGLGEGAPRPAAAVDVEIEVTPAVFEAERQLATFDWHAVPDGYGWLFPKREVLSCGVGMWRPHPLRLLDEADAFLQRSLPPSSVRRVVKRSGHPVPLFAGHRPLATARAMLAGDAAHLVDPVLGEGIAYALESGLLAAEVLARLAGAPTGPLPEQGMVTVGAAALITEALAEHGDARAYSRVIRFGLGRHLNRVRLLNGARFFGDPDSFFAGLARPGEPYA